MERGPSCVMWGVYVRVSPTGSQPQRVKTRSYFLLGNSLRLKNVELEARPSSFMDPHFQNSRKKKRKEKTFPGTCTCKLLNQNFPEIYLWNIALHYFVLFCRQVPVIGAYIVECRIIISYISSLNTQNVVGHKQHEDDTNLKCIFSGISRDKIYLQ